MRTTTALVAMFVMAWMTGCEDKTAKKKPAPPSAVPEKAAPAAAAKPESVQVHKLLQALEAFNALNFAEVEAVLAEAHEGMVAQTGQAAIQGRQAFLDYIKQVHLAFPDVRVRARRILDTGEFWVLEGVLTGTHQGDFLGQKATMKKVGCQFALFAWVEKGAVTRTFLCGNPLAIVKQMQSPADALPAGLTGPARPEVISQPGNPAQVEAVKSFFQSFEDADLNVLYGLMDKDVVVRAYGDGKVVRGLDALRDVLLREREAFEGRIEVEQIAAAGPYVAALVRLKGKLKGTVGDLQATGKTFTERGVDVFRFEGGRIKTWDNYRNLMDLMTQLGLYPPPMKAE